jgi:hypothetical protein
MNIIKKKIWDYCHVSEGRIGNEILFAQLASLEEKINKFHYKNDPQMSNDVRFCCIENNKIKRLFTLNESKRILKLNKL